jgi:isoleucyl-tRNA synthetase
LADFPLFDSSAIDSKLENQMEIAQRISSLVLALRKKEKIRVRQPLQKIMVPSLSEDFTQNIMHVKDLILSEVNVKELELIDENSDLLVKRIKPNFKTIGPKYGKQMKAIADKVGQFSNAEIAEIEKNSGCFMEIEGVKIELELVDFEITAQDIPGWLVATEEGLTVALDISISQDLRAEGIARELINRVQNLRKDKDLEVTDRIALLVDTTQHIRKAIEQNVLFIGAEVLANSIDFDSLDQYDLITDIESAEDTRISIKINS